MTLGEVWEGFGEIASRRYMGLMAGHNAYNGSVNVDLLESGQGVLLNLIKFDC